MNKRILLILMAFIITSCAPAAPLSPSPTAIPPTFTVAPPAVTATALPSPIPTATASTTSTLPPSPTTGPTATATPGSIRFASPEFVFQGADPSLPIVTRNPSPQIDNRYINPGAVLFHAGQFHMFFNSFTDWPGVIQVGYMTSPNGYRWQMVQAAPVFTTDQIPYSQGFADISSVYVQEDGTWVMVFHTINKGTIGRATAPAPTGPWSADPEPFLEGGPSGSWDRFGLFWPQVVAGDEGYHMYYGGKTSGGFAIGLATSVDGLHWEKYDDPQTTEEAFADSDPVLTADAQWDANTVNRPRVQHTPDGWVMLYQGGPVEKRGLAISKDGIHWETFPSNPIFSPEVFPIPNAKTWDTALVYHERAYYYFMEIGSLRGTDLYLAKHEGPLTE